jgi:type I restriction enzyme S subunit
MLDVSPTHLEIVRAILRNHVPDLEVFAFGSRVQGTARRYSDLDLAVMTQAPLCFAVLGALQEDFSASDLPFRVDILDWAATQDSFRRVIERDRIVVQAA